MLILASGSPRRRELLTQIGVAYMVNPSTYSEESPKKKDPEKYVQAQALGKARDVAGKFPGQWVLGADTMSPSMGKCWASPVMKPLPSRCCGNCPVRNTLSIRASL